MTSTLHITTQGKSVPIPGLPKRKQEFGSRHRDNLRCCQTHAFLPTKIIKTIQPI